MSLRTKRQSVSSVRSESPLMFRAAPSPDAEEWTKTWRRVYARELVDTPIVAVDADTSVEDACDLLLSKDILCLVINRPAGQSPSDQPYLGLFDFSDVNSFLTLAATRHRSPIKEQGDQPRTAQIISAARAGRVPVHLVSNLSDKNPLETLPYDATVVSLLTVFSTGAHRVLIQSQMPSQGYLGMVSDRALLSWFASPSQRTSSVLAYLSNPLSFLPLPSLFLYSSVVACKASDTVLNAMMLMSNEGVSSVAVLEEEGGSLLSAVSVTDIGKIVVPAQSKRILATPLHQFISRIKEPDGSTDGVDKYPVYSVAPSSTLLYTMQKLLATNSHRLFVVDEPQTSSPPSTYSTAASANLSGIVSVVDILSLFARIANVPDVDPTRMQRHRRASSSSTGTSSNPTSSPTSRRSSQSGRSPELRGQHGADAFARSRSSSRTGFRRMPVGESLRSSASSLESFQWADRVPEKK